MVDDRDLARTVSPYQWRQPEDEDAGSGSTFLAVVDAINRLLTRVAAIEQKLGDKPAGQPERVYLAKAPSKRPASGRAPTGETMHRRAKIRIRP